MFTGGPMKLLLNVLMNLNPRVPGSRFVRLAVVEAGGAAGVVVDGAAMFACAVGNCAAGVETAFGPTPAVADAGAGSY
jgi:hypothetical protein